MMSFSGKGILELIGVFIKSTCDSRDKSFIQAVPYEIYAILYSEYNALIDMP